MALVFRSIVEIERDLLADAEPLLTDWLRQKVRDKNVTLDDGSAVAGGVTFEFSRTEASDDVVRVWRGHVFEQRADEQVRLSFTALTDGTLSWSWIDVDRWTEQPWNPGWIPFAPKLISQLLDRHPGRVGATPLRSSAETIREEEAATLARHLVDEERVVPIVVVSPTREEREGDHRPCAQRTAGLQRHLAGVARVVSLGRGATTELSRSLTDLLGAGWDVHSGAVRTYLPGVGQPGDDRRRHRVVPYRRLAGRPPATAGRLASLPLIQAACLQPPPPVWQERARLLPAFTPTPDDDAEIEEFLAEAEREREQALKEASDARRRLGEAQETVAEVLAQHDVLSRRISYLEGKLAQLDAASLHAQPPDEDVFEAEWCEEVAERASETLDGIVVADRVAATAGELDVHADNASWARKAWRALQALDAYAKAKRAGEASGWDFKRFCQNSDSPAVIPSSWVSLHESETTAENRRFRELRTLPVDTAVDSSGRVYMPGHIRIERGGTPCPRIHFFDDTDGATGRVHVGWFGDHLDSSAKS